MKDQEEEQIPPQRHRSMQECPEAKKPCKGILKTSKSFDRSGARKSAKFDEYNVLQTFHPADKDYGHMKIDEPKTPYNYDDASNHNAGPLNAELLAEKLRVAANTQTPAFGTDDLSDEEFPETTEEKIRRLEFERRRKAHYNEFEAVRIARKLIEEELTEDTDEETVDEATETSKSVSEFASEEYQDDHLADVLETEEESEAITKRSDDSVSPNASSANVDRSMDVDQLDPSHPCAGRQH